VILLQVWLHAKLKYETNWVLNTQEIDNKMYIQNFLGLVMWFRESQWHINSLEIYKVPEGCVEYSLHVNYHSKITFSDPKSLFSLTTCGQYRCRIQFGFTQTNTIWSNLTSKGKKLTHQTKLNWEKTLWDKNCHKIWYGRQFRLLSTF
jgi:hypothetical protein